MPAEGRCGLSVFFVSVTREVDREHTCLLMPGSDDSVVRLKGFYCLVYVV